METDVLVELVDVDTLVEVLVLEVLILVEVD